MLTTTYDSRIDPPAEPPHALGDALSRMKTILFSIGEGVLLEDPERNFIPLNTRAEIVLQEMASNFLHGPLREVAPGSTDYMIEPNPWILERRRFEVGKKVLSARSAVIQSVSGEHLGTVIVLRDVTTEAEAERLKNVFVAHVSHELRTPLTAIKGYSELMLFDTAGSLNDEQRCFLKAIDRHTDNLVNMINTLLDFSEMEAWGSLNLRLHPVQLSKIVRETVDAWRPEMDEKGLEFEVEISADLPLVSADVKRLRWVIVNLVRNAWQYTPEGGKVTVRLDTQDGKVILEVTDTGIGISRRDQQRLFSRFYRVANTALSRGIGLGLYVSKAIVEEHGGEIRVSSRAGVGSTFSIILPALSGNRIP